jgi:hypothetical protein
VSYYKYGSISPDFKKLLTLCFLTISCLNFDVLYDNRAKSMQMLPTDGASDSVSITTRRKRVVILHTINPLGQRFSTCGPQRWDR